MNTNGMCGTLSIGGHDIGAVRGFAIQRDDDPFGPSMPSVKSLSASLDMAFLSEAREGIARLVQESRTHSIQIARDVVAWRFPKDKFVEYGPEDEQWARFFGVGSECVVRETVDIPNAMITSQRGNEMSFQFGGATSRVN